MKQKLLSFILLLSIGITSAYAYDFSKVAPSGQRLYYTIISSGSTPTVAVTCPNSSLSTWYGYTKPTGSLTIPSTVTYGGTTYSVISIRDHAFWACTSLTSVTIPNSITTIGEGAFSSCTSLPSISIPNSVHSIGKNAFELCHNLASVTIPNSVTSIGDTAFAWCTNLTSITIPNSITKIGAYTFAGCDSLASVTIPYSVTTIGDYAFYWCSLSSVTIPSSVYSIGEGAFCECSSLSSVTIPNSVTSIGIRAFAGCSSLSSVTIPNSITSIGIRAFVGCSSLASVSIPNTVTSIGDSAFCNCSSLTTIIARPTVAPSVGYSTFGTGSYLSINNIYIPCGSRSSYASKWGWGASFYTEVLFDSVHVVSADESMGTAAVVTQPTCASPIATITATPDSGCAFFNWTERGSVVSTESTYTFTLTADRYLTAHFGYQISPSVNWQTHSASTTGSINGENKYKVYLTANNHYIFKTGCGDGATANYDTYLELYNSNGTQLAYDDDGCNYHSSKIEYTPTSSGYVYLVVSGYGGETGSYTLAYRNLVSCTITVSANPTTGGTVSGGSTYYQSDTCTLIATPASGYVFTNWTEDGTVVSANSEYTFTVTSNKTLTAHFAPAVTCGIALTDLPYTNNFDSYTNSTSAKTGVQPDCWTLSHQDVAMTDEYKPMIYYSSVNAHSGNYSLLINKRGIYAMPEFDGDVSTLQLSMYLKQGMAKYQLQVGVISDPSDVSTFVPVATLNNSSIGVEHVTVSFAPYRGTGRYIAFRNILAAGNSGDFSCNYIDDLVLDLRPVNTCTGITVDDLPFTDNFDTYTSSTTAKTGVAPDCWTLAKQDVNMTDEYKPMIYYNSSCAHSGGYSLILNKRGIYAMPAYDGDVSTLQLSMYLRQSATKYRLQVGVMSDLSNPGTFVPVAILNNSSTGIEHVTVSFASYTGAGQYIAFRNILPAGNSGDFSCNYIDDLVLDLRPVNTCTGITVDDLPYTDNFDSYTASTTAKTGVSPDCWTLAYQEVAMTDEYKPMVYYNTSNAHSGSYSLILNKRCLYAMPAYDGDVSTLQLSFYLKQTNASYGLTVGVMSDLGDPSTFVPVASFNNPSTANHEYVDVDFSSYTGNGHYIAFRNTNTAISNFSCNYIDDLTLDLRPSNCGITVDDLPYTDNFDSYTTSTTAKTGVAPDCWTLAYQEVAMTDEYKPMIYYNSSNAHSGSYSLLINKRCLYAMPAYDGNVSALQLSFYLKQTSTNYGLTVGVMSDLEDPSTFVPVASFNNPSTANHEYVVVDFSSYTGDGHYIAFRNTNTAISTFSCNYIDDLTLELRSGGCGITMADLPYTDNFDSYTASTTAKTGVAPDCWTLAHQDVVMTDEYKPMIYYNASCAHSSSYSLMLNKRGIYAMPAYEGDVRDLQLSFYVRQTQAKYQLQVGVMTDLSNVSTFVPVATFNNTSTTASVLRTVNFASYTGNGHYIAFRNILAAGQTGDYSCNYIDDLTLSMAGAKSAMHDDNHDVAVHHEMNVYPNPTSGMLIVEADEEVERVEVYDYTGRCVATYEKQTTIDLSRLATGIYTLRVTLPERIEVRRVVKQ